MPRGHLEHFVKAAHRLIATAKAGPSPLGGLLDPMGLLVLLLAILLFVSGSLAGERLRLGR